MSHQTSISAIGWSFPLKVFVKCRKESLRVIKERRDSGKPAKLTRFVRISASSWKTLLHCCLNRKLALIWLKQKWFPSFLLFPLYKISSLTMPQEKSLTQLFGSLFIPCIIWWAGQTVGYELVQLFVTSFLFLSFQEPCQRRYSCQALSTALQRLLNNPRDFLKLFSWARDSPQIWWLPRRKVGLGNLFTKYAKDHRLNPGQKGKKKSNL